MKLLIQSIRQTIVWTVLTGIVYPLVITGIAQLAFHDQANGSLIQRDGKIVGSTCWRSNSRARNISGRAAFSSFPAARLPPSSIREEVAPLACLKT